MKKHIIGYSVVFAIGVLMFFGVLGNYDFFHRLPELSRTEVLQHLGDACFVPGLLLVLFGILAWISYTGFFDGISYGAVVAFHALWPFARSKREEKYYDYKVARAERRRKPQNYLLWVGLVFIAVSLGIYWGYYYPAK